MFGISYSLKFPTTKCYFYTKYLFETREDRSRFLMSRGKYGKKWWEHLPFVERRFWTE